MIFTYFYHPFWGTPYFWVDTHIYLRIFLAIKEWHQPSILVGTGKFPTGLPRQVRLSWDPMGWANEMGWAPFFPGFPTLSFRDGYII